MKKFVHDVITIKDVGEVTKEECIFQKRDGTFLIAFSGIPMTRKDNNLGGLIELTK